MTSPPPVAKGLIIILLFHVIGLMVSTEMNWLSIDLQQPSLPLVVLLIDLSVKSTALPPLLAGGVDFNQ